jgi:predicted tellurium resistance membrane protein TerC
MENDIYQIILNEPILLALVIIFCLIIIYSILKKFFKLLLLTFGVILIYIGFLIYSGDELPGESEKVINPIVEKSSLVLEIISIKLKSFFEKDSKN